MARLTLTEPGEDVVVGGSVEVIGTLSGDERIRIDSGNITLDSSFNRGGDVIILPGFASNYTVELIGSRVLITNGALSISIPVGTTGITVEFSDFGASLSISTETETVLLGQQTIDTDPAQIDPNMEAPSEIASLDFLGEELLVYTNSPNIVLSDPQVVHLASGDILIHWSNKVQILSPGGEPLGPELVISEIPGGMSTAIAALPNGGFVISWMEPTIDGGIVGQVFSPTGAPVSGQFDVSVENVRWQEAPSMAVLPDGSFLIAWQDDSRAGGDTSETAVKARIFDPSGVPITDEFVVPTDTLSWQAQPEVLAIGDQFLVTWMHYVESESGSFSSDLRGQLISSSGEPVGSELHLVTGEGDQAYMDLVATTDGGFAMVYWDAGHVIFQAFDGSGSKIGAVSQVSVETSWSAVPDIVQLPSGAFLVTWAGAGNDDGDVLGRIVSSSGHAVDDVFQINTTEIYNQSDPAISVGADGELLVVWIDGSLETGGYAIRAQFLSESTGFEAVAIHPEVFA